MSATCCSRAPHRGSVSSPSACRWARRAARLIQQLLTESLELAVAGGALGWLLAWLGTRTLSHNLPPVAAGLSAAHRAAAKPSAARVHGGGHDRMHAALRRRACAPRDARRHHDAAQGRREAPRHRRGRSIAGSSSCRCRSRWCSSARRRCSSRRCATFRNSTAGIGTTRVLLAYVDTRGTSLETPRDQLRSIRTA